MSLQISRILHAGYVFQYRKTQIAFDPIFENPFSRNCYAFPNVKFDHEKIKTLNFDAIFISHFHDDHCSLESLNLLDRRTPIYMFCVFVEIFALIKELGFVEVYSLQLDVPIQIGEIEIIPRRALDEDVDAIFHIKAGGVNVLNVVDSWIDEATLKVLAQSAPWDLVLWPFQTMREIEVLAPLQAAQEAGPIPPEWSEQLQILNPRFVVPSSCQFVQESWSWYNQALFPITYKKFQNEIESLLPKARVVRMNPSVSISLDQNSIATSPALNWIFPVGEQNVDYDFRIDCKPQLTAEIAQKFSPLSFEQSERVYRYCCEEIFEKYLEIGPANDSYFDSPRYWKLSIYDHIGEVRCFHFLLTSSIMQAYTGELQNFDWSTELPIAKFYAALEFGEALTSIYVRINAAEGVDVIEDPLVRCLFSGNFGSYQKAQLRLLKTSTGHSQHSLCK
jgi:L-ascorbate metabolism protein UlaG (beta-lactamase superfamily)